MSAENEQWQVEWPSF